ncbi:PRI1 [Candida pseudojiufengensis]|uniref:PRI1 n=1 Tax=Candida pseudojiufengensis TaxID=497109 RepID=UPI0022247B7E|nr:PRI1 [Candida pseudojiufengensis]KAI5958680.1 PRI1 [Candida pseudojiufengensis]
MVPAPIIDSDDSQIQSSKPSEVDMEFYYKRLLPFKYIFNWLSHSPKPTKDFIMREFAYEFRSGAYQRYNSYSNVEEFKKSVIKAIPTRFEIGAVYKVAPKERHNLPKQALKPLTKELVFDIDLTDYDDIRTCCQGTDICCKCWKFIQVGSKIIEDCLRQDFGFKHMIWVFSGRRGAHCWISDKRARELDEQSRRSIVEYLDVLGAKHVKSSKGIHVKRPFHPHIERSFEVMKNSFIDIILEDQDPWYTDSETKEDSKNWKQINDLLNFIPNKELQIELRKKWKSNKNVSRSKEKWEDINTLASKIFKSNLQVGPLMDAKKDIIIFYLYPRLDIEVSRQIIHLLKSPFCIHPGTGNVCVPFNPLKNISGNSQDDAYGFNPTTSPNLKTIQNELEAWESKSSQVNDIPSWDKTSLKPYVDYFKQFVGDLLKSEENKEKRELENPYEF